MNAAPTIVRYNISIGGTGEAGGAREVGSVGEATPVGWVGEAREVGSIRGAGAGGHEQGDGEAIEQRRRGNRQRISGRLRLDCLAGEHIPKQQRMSIQVGE